MRDSELDRLLRAAAAAKTNHAPASDFPFGFDTRVVARWRSRRREQSAELQEVNRIFGRLAVVAITVAAFAGVGAYWQLNSNEDVASSVSLSYAIADSTIESGALR